MANIIVLLIVAVIICFAVRESIRHFKGQGACCGGGGGELPPEEKKLDGPVTGKKTLHISGMSCEHCVNAVTAAVNKIDGASAKVSLRGKKAVVSLDREVDTEVLKKAVEKAGYQVVSVDE